MYFNSTDHYRILIPVIFLLNLLRLVSQTMNLKMIFTFGNVNVSLTETLRLNGCLIMSFLSICFASLTLPQIRTE